MKKTSSKSTRPVEMKKEYRFDYRTSKPNRFTKGLVVVIEPDNAKTFRTEKAVNSTLRAVKELLPKVAKAQEA